MPQAGTQFALAMDDSGALAAVAEMVERGELKAADDSKARRVWIHAPAKTSKNGALLKDIWSADEGWERWLRCSGDDDDQDAEDRRVESTEWWEKRKTVQESDRLSVAGSRKSILSSMGIMEPEPELSGQVLEAELAKLFADLQLPCVRIRRLEDLDTASEDAAFAANTAQFKSRALRSLAAVYARCRPHTAEEAFKPLPALRATPGHRSARSRGK